MLVALEYLDFTKIVRCFSATCCHSMLITRKNSDLQWSQPFLYIRARNADVYHNLNVSNPIPKVYTIYGLNDIHEIVDINFCCALSNHFFIFLVI